MPSTGLSKAIRVLSILVGTTIVASVGVFARHQITADDSGWEPPAVKAISDTGRAPQPPTPAPPPSTYPTTLPTPPVFDDTDKLIHQLSGPDADAAADKLFDRGPAVLDRLRRAAKIDSSPETRVRAAALVAAITDRDAGGPTPVTLHLEDGVAADAWAVIARQGRCQITGMRTAFPERRVHLDAKADPFWSVVTDVCAQTGVAPVVDSPPDHTLNLFPSAHNWLADTPHQIVGPYWLGVVGIDRRRTIPLVVGDAGVNTFDVRMVLYAEPKLSLYGVSDFVVESATDDAGNALQPDPPVPVLFDKPVSHTITARLRYPAQPGREIKEVSGKAVVLLAEGNQRFKVDDVLGKPMATNPVDGCDITATVTAASPGLYQVKVVCDRQAMADQQWRAMIAGVDGLVLSDATGRPLRGLPWAAEADHSSIHFEAAATFAKDHCGDPKTIAWDIASRFVRVEIPATFRNLPMP
jgi:hypothetical protein